MFCPALMWSLLAKHFLLIENSAFFMLAHEMQPSNQPGQAGNMDVKVD